MARQDLQFNFPRRIAHGDPQQETVELTLRQGVGAFELDGILRGDDHERVGQGVALPVDRNLPLAHGLQQGDLRAGRGPVDFVGQHDIGENRSRTEGKLPRFGVVNAAARDVAGQQIGRELNAAEFAGQAAGNGLAHQRFAHAGNIFQEDMFAREEGHGRQSHDLVLAQHHAADILAQLANERFC